MSLPLYQVDSFASSPFGGNPAAVCIMPADAQPSSQWLASVAMEMNLSETAFVTPRPDGEFDLRWFTPADEVELCGHATLASAHILWTTNRVPKTNSCVFHTLSGALSTRLDDTWIEMDFPSQRAEPTDAPEGLVESLGIVPTFIGKNRTDYLIEVKSESKCLEMQPNFRSLAETDARGVIVTAKSEQSSQDFVSRFFAPRFGIDEDPVTGSAHCCLAPYWSEKLGTSELIGYQASPRGGFVRVQNRGDRVGLFGKAVTVLTGELTIDIS